MPDISQIKCLDANYDYTLQTLDHESWHSIIRQFDDASLYQTEPFCTEREGTHACEHLLLTCGPDVVAAAQVRLMSIPYMGMLIAYVLSAPLFQRRDAKPHWEAFRQIIRALKIEYVINRKISLRINTLLTNDEESLCMPILLAEGFSYKAPTIKTRTMLVDLNRPLDELRRGLEQKWRNCLNRAEKNNLQILEGSNEEILDGFLTIYHKMLSRKGLSAPGDINTIHAVQKKLPDDLKMHIAMVFEDGEPTAGVIISGVGKRGIYLFGATADSGMKNKASYLAQWHVIKWLKENQCTQYDLNGVNAESNPGVYNFKNGICGKNGKEVEILGYFEAYGGIRSQLVLSFAENVRQLIKNSQAVYAKYRQ
jgi:hypothetical protein